MTATMEKFTELPSQEFLSEILRYDHQTGNLFWRSRSQGMFKSTQAWRAWSARFSGREAFATANNKGHKVGSISGTKYLAHRVVWTLLHGDIPIGMQIDHINGVKSDNRASNLRLATSGQNRHNTGKRADNTSGFKGVTWCKHAQKWQAQIKVNKKYKFLGYFSDETIAAAAYSNAAEVLHGEFFHGHHEGKA